MALKLVTGIRKSGFSPSKTVLGLFGQVLQGFLGDRDEMPQSPCQNVYKAHSFTPCRAAPQLKGQGGPRSLGNVLPTGLWQVRRADQRALRHILPRRTVVGARKFELPWRRPLTSRSGRTSASYRLSKSGYEAL